LTPKKQFEQDAHHLFSLPARKPLSLAAKHKRARKVAEAEGMTERVVAALRLIERLVTPLEKSGGGKKLGTTR
jgi:hypothetical protein